MSMSNNIGNKGRKDRRSTPGSRTSRPAYLPWGDRNHRNNSPSSPEPSQKPPRGPRMRSNIDKSGLTDGIYSNVRMTHSATSIVGCVVQIQVRNGGTYEGILKTFSPKMDIVLEKAHKLDETQGSIPSKDRLIDTVIFNFSDVVTITASNVELDYANKDTFTDTAISKFNGQITEKELQPWEADAPTDDSLELLETDPSVPTTKYSSKPGQNGWDPVEMFQTNADQFNVQSSYDPNMPEYTIQLRADNSKEFREREARAAKLASEIEGSESYKQRIALENGDGDEEAKYSAVIRDGPSGGSLNSGKLDLAHVVVQDRYVPPQLRGTRGIRRTINRAKSPVVSNATTPTSPSTQPNHPPMATQEPEPKVNGDKEEKGEVTGGEKNTDTNGEKEGKEHSPPLGKGDSRKPPRARDQQIKELREFSSNFKLGENENKERERKGSSHSTSPQPQLPPAPATTQSQNPQQPVPLASNPQPTSSPNANTPSPADKTDDKKKNSDPADEKKAELDKLSDTVKKSTLNPLAKEFVFNPTAKPFTPKQPIQVSTPPRLSTQSPNMPMMPHQMPAGISQPLYQQMYVPVSMSQQVIQQQQPQQQTTRFPAKRAVVSVRPEYNTAAQQAAAATGQPLLAQTMPQQPQYMPYHVTPSGTVPQMMPVAQARMVGPNQMGQPGHPGQDPQVQQGQGQHVYMTGAQAVPAHLQHHPGAGPTPPHQTSHMTSHQAPQSATPQHNQQPSHINQQSGAHPAQSPVQPQAHPVTGHHQQQPHHPHHQQHQQHHQQQQQHHPTSHHSAAAAAAAAAGQHQHHNVVTSVTQQQHPNHHQGGHQPNNPNQQQPHLIYPNPQMTQPPHPPLQPSPHTPTSPQSMHPHQLGFAPPFSYTTQTGVQGGPQLSYSHNHPHTTVTHAQHQQHTHAPQIIMMPPHQGQMTPTGGPPTHMHGPPQGPIMQGPVHGQAGPHMVPQNAIGVPSSSMHPQIHYMSHHPQMNSQHPPPLQAAYQHSQ